MEMVWMSNGYDTADVCHCRSQFDRFHTFEDKICPLRLDAKSFGWQAAMRRHDQTGIGPGANTFELNWAEKTSNPINRVTPQNNIDNRYSGRFLGSNPPIFLRALGSTSFRCGPLFFGCWKYWKTLWTNGWFGGKTHYFRLPCDLEDSGAL